MHWNAGMGFMDKTVNCVAVFLGWTQTGCFSFNCLKLWLEQFEIKITACLTCCKFFLITVLVESKHVKS